MFKIAVSFKVILLRVSLKPYILEKPGKIQVEKNLKFIMMLLISLNLTFTILKFTKKHNKT